MEKGEGITGVAKLDLSRSPSHSPSQAEAQLQTGNMESATKGAGGEDSALEGEGGDCLDCTVGSYNLGKGRKGGEPIFVPRPAENGTELEEDDGYLLFLVYDSKTE